MAITTLTTKANIMLTSGSEARPYSKNWRRTTTLPAVAILEFAGFNGIGVGNTAEQNRWSNFVFDCWRYK